MATPQTTPEPLLRFCDSLRDLKRVSGAPSLGDLSRRMTPRPSVSTLSHLFAARIRRAPRWELVHELVDACREHARANGITLPDDLRSPEAWRRRHEDLVRAMEGTATQRPPSGLAHLLRLAPDGRPPCLGELTDAELGVSRPLPGARDGYITRADFDEEMRSMLSLDGPPYPYVLAYGEEGAGKTRSAVAALRAEFPAGTPLLIPRDGASVCELPSVADALDRLDRPAVVWLDDLTAADLEQLTLDLLEWLSGRAVIAGTISGARCGEILGGPHSGPAAVARAALRRACLVHLPLELDDAERAEAAWHFEDGTVPGSFAKARDGVPEPREMLVRLHTARSANPVGVALVRAAIDCDRAGLPRGVTRGELRRLLPPYLEKLSAPPATDAEFERGLDWARTPVAGGRALLQSVGSAGLAPGEPRWKAARELVGEADSGPVPDALWRKLIGAATPKECLSIGARAADRNAPAHAAAAFTKAAEHEEHRLDALLGLAEAQRLLGSAAAAKATFRRVIESDEPARTARAACLLGQLLQQEGDAVGAEEAWRLAGATGHQDYAPWALNELARMLIQQGDWTEAEAVWGTVVDSGHPEAAPRAWAMLGMLREHRGDHQGALAAWERAGEWSNPFVARMSEESVPGLHSRMAELAELRGGGPDHDAEVLLERGERLWNLGDVAGSLAAYREAAASEDPEVRARALFGMATTLVTAKRRAEAVEVLESAARCGVPLWEAKSLFEIGSILEADGDWDGAHRAWSRAVATGVPDETEPASVNLGLLELRADNLDLAMTAFRHAVDARNPHIRAKAALNLALLGTEAGMAEDAVDDWYRVAIATDDPEYMPQAAFALGGRLVERGHRAEPERLFRRAMESGDPEAPARGEFLLGMLHEFFDEVEEAVAAYRRAIDSGHPKYVVQAHERLGSFCYLKGRTEAACWHLQTALDAADPEHSPEAGFALAAIHWETGEYDRAELVLRQLVETGRPDVAARAGYMLADVQETSGRTEEARRAWNRVTEQGVEPYASKALVRLDELDAWEIPDDENDRPA